MITDRVSIIVPVFNVESYLPQCLDSVCRQTFRDLQIILIDDGSTDKSGIICDQYALKDSRFHVIHETNKGLAEARNVGIGLANNEFIFFLDSDDYLEPNAIESLLEAQRKSMADITVGSYYYTYPSYETPAACSFSESICLSNIQAMQALVLGDIETFAWGKLIRSDLVKRHLFPRGKLFEDHFWTHYIIGDGERITVIPSPLVHYRQRENSISYSFSIERMDVIEGWKDRISFLEGRYLNLVDVYKSVLVDRYINLAWVVLTRMKKDKTKAFDLMRQFSVAQHLSEFAQEGKREVIKSLEKSDFAYACIALRRKILRENDSRN